MKAREQIKFLWGIHERAMSHAIKVTESSAEDLSNLLLSLEQVKTAQSIEYLINEIAKREDAS